ncbi:MAG: TraM recognition domain-containing protein [Saprospiraceae bacterium]|nr:TraM recognition domain-containing protein [Saprospiraceae bacterium]
MDIQTFDLEQAIYHFNGVEPFTIGNACEGVQIFGGIGSGKTSGSGAALAKAMLSAGFGGLVLCAKKDELETWVGNKEKNIKGYAQETGRENSFLVFDASGKFVFPFLQYEIERGGEGAGYTENLVRLFTTVYEAISRSRSGGGSDPYWERAMQQLLRNAIDLLMIVRGTTSVSLIHDVIMSAAKSKEERIKDEWQDKSLCWNLLLEGYAKKQAGYFDTWVGHDFDSTASFWLEEYPNLDEKTRSNILSTLTTMMDNFLRRPFRQLFSEPPADRRQIALPELTHKGIVIIINLPVKEFGDAGRAAQVVYKYLWQQAAERRNVKENPRPVFLWVDEAQNFATEYDMQFQATARSSRACTVYLTQNLPNYYAEMGGEHSKYRVDSLVGNLQTKIFHANSDPTTNEFASNVIGKSWQQRDNMGTSIGGQSFNISQGQSESYDYDVIPQEFTRLRKGGIANGKIVEGVVFQNGRIWESNEKTYLFTTFKQS